MATCEALFAYSTTTVPPLRVAPSKFHVNDVALDEVTALQRIWFGLPETQL